MKDRIGKHQKAWNSCCSLLKMYNMHFHCFTKELYIFLNGTQAELGAHPINTLDHKLLSANQRGVGPRLADTRGYETLLSPVALLA